ncbi:FecR domain-containing protein [Brevundimonas sp.]|uniref:FecR family protein n=1 Tax=Brevundimonas sp. TaxID=1871086 RepID=UPI00289C8CA8|nr:FecR domain-containing protein [Brevundimonas sp.]
MQGDRKIRQEAADWFIAQRRGPMSLEERQAFDAWRSDPVHQAALNHAHEIWGELAAIRDSAADYPHRKRKPIPRWAAGAIAASLAVGLIGIVSMGVLERANQPVLITDIGEQRSQQLSDGSIVALNVVSRARYDINEQERVIYLNEGEATFLVQKDPERPFLVKSGGYEVRAVGTAFNVRNRHQSLEIAVKEGVVEVRHPSTGNKTVRLTAGQKFQIPLNKPATLSSTKINTIPTASVDEWRQRILTFEDAPIDQVIRDINLFYDRPVAVEPTQGSRHVTMRVEIGDRAETLKRLSILLNTQVKDAAAPR